MIIQLPNGETAEFPDNMQPAEVEAVLQKHLPPTPDTVASTLSLPVEGTLKDIGKGFVNQLPMAGMITGGALGTGATLGPWGAPVGAGLGAGIGTAARNWINQGLDINPPKPTLENWQDIGKEALIGTGAEMAGPLLAQSQPMMKVVAPYADATSKIATENATAAAAQKLIDQGAPISPDVVNPSFLPEWATWLADKMWPANSIMARYRGQLPELANTLKNEFVNSRNLYGTSKAGVNDLWENWVSQAGGTAAPYEMPKTLAALNDAMGKPFAMMTKTTTDAAGNAITENIPQGTFWKKYASTLRDTLENNGQATVQDVRDLLSVLNPTGAKGAERTARMKIGDAIMEDLGASGNTEMVNSLAQAREGARLQRIAAPLQNLFNKSMKDNIRTGTMDFNPDTFVNLWQQQRDKFLNSKNYSAEDVRVIDAFADKMRAVVPDMARLNSFNPSLNQLNFQNPLPVMGMVYAKPYLAVPVGMDMALAQSLMNPNGIMRRFLTTGFGPPNLSTKVAIQKGMEASND